MLLFILLFVYSKAVVSSVIGARIFLLSLMGEKKPFCFSFSERDDTRAGFNIEIEFDTLTRHLKP